MEVTSLHAKYGGTEIKINVAFLCLRKDGSQMELNTKAINQFIITHGYTQTTFAKLIGLNVSSLGKLLKKQRKASFRTLGLIAKATGLSYTDLVIEE